MSFSETEIVANINIILVKQHKSCTNLFDVAVAGLVKISRFTI